MVIVTRALDGTGVTIDNDVNRRIAQMSAGFPHPVHLLGAAAFEADTDDVLTNDDLDKGIHCVVTEKWKDALERDYIAAGSGRSRLIVNAMATWYAEDVPVAHVCRVLDLQPRQISSNIRVLMQRDVILRPRRGVYRFRDPLFRHYVRYLEVLGEEPAEIRPRRRRRGPVP